MSSNSKKRSFSPTISGVVGSTVKAACVDAGLAPYKLSTWVFQQLSAGKSVRNLDYAIKQCKKDDEKKLKTSKTRQRWIKSLEDEGYTVIRPDDIEV